jgi:hypothetical protein
VHSRSLRSGQEFGDSVPDTPVKKGMHIFFTLRLVHSVATKNNCVIWMVRVTRHINSVLANSMSTDTTITLQEMIKEAQESLDHCLYRKSRCEQGGLNNSELGALVETEILIAQESIKHLQQIEKCGREILWTAVRVYLLKNIGALRRQICDHEKSADPDKVKIKRISDDARNRIIQLGLMLGRIG